MNNLKIRKLTPKECWRLMGFDDEYFDKAAKVHFSPSLSRDEKKKTAEAFLCCP